MPKKEVFSLELNVGANITQARNAATQLRDAFAKINLSDSLKGSLEKTFTNLEKELANFEGMANKPFTNMKDVQKAEKSYERIVDLFNELSIQGKNISGMDPNKFLPKEIINRINTLQTSLKSVRTTINNTNKAIESQNREYNQASQQQINYQNKIKETEGAIKSYQGSLSATTRALNDTQKKQSELTQKQQEYLDNGGKKSDPQYQQLGRELSALQKQYAGLSSTQNNYRKQIGELKADLNGYVASEKAAGESAQKHKEEVDKLKQSLQNPQGLTELREEISKLSGIPLDQITTDTDELEKEITKLSQAQLKQISEDLKLVGDKSKDISNTANSVGDLDKKVDELGNDAGKLTETAAEIERLGNQVKQFFSIGNTIQLFKRAVRDAMNTVKELDATMTETATVTDFSISDMWQQLPHYTEEANKLGTSINSLYKATTLYYQQGLQTNEAMALGIETIKMARVANMDAAQATDLMTAALRGFNMELNEQSAIRINDVYSELAAVTAADTDEIGIAISKTASIAHSANMEFETTAAFLSQIIETTREAPETAGTAMKTIVARFSEVKKLYSEGQITGTDEEGEVVNVNKIQEALRTVGIDMTKFFTGKEGLDQVLLRLAEKWNTLDVVTQRYIATQAAGSRQQSRFLAMMSDYDRTLELVDAAYNSAGSGQAQFEKTLDSVQAKLSELKNAWDQFTMGIANSDFVKAGIDLLTKLLSVINDIISAISGGNGLVKSVASIGTAFLALRTGAKIFGGSGFIGKILSVLTGSAGKKEGEKAGKVLASAVSTGLKNTLSGKSGKEGIFSAFKEVFSNKTGGIGEAIKGFFKGDTWKSLTQKSFSGMESNIDKETLMWDVLGNKGGNFTNLDLDPGIIANSINDGNIDEAWNEFRRQIEESGESFDQFQQKINDSPKQVKASAMQISAAFTGVGIALQGIGKLVGDNVAGDIISTFGTIATTVGALIPIVSTLGDAFLGAGTSAKIAGWIAQSGWIWLVGITAIIGTVMALAQLTPEKQLERAQKKAEESAKAAEEAQKAYDDLLSNRSNYNELEEKVNSLTQGTIEWQEAVDELNKKVMELSQTYSGLEYEIDEVTGALKITEKSWAKVTEQSKKEAREALAASSSDQIAVAQAKIKKAEKENRVKRYKNKITGAIETETDIDDILGNVSKKAKENYIKINYTPVVNTDLGAAKRELKTARKNMILAFMPESVDKSEANKVGSAMAQLIGDSLDKETDPNKIQNTINEFYRKYSEQEQKAKDLFAGKTIFVDSENYEDFGITKDFYNKYKTQVDELIAANEDRVLKVKDELARIGTDLFTVGEEDAEALAQKTESMGTEEAKAYYKAWDKVKSQNKKVASNLLGLEISNINDLTSVIKMLRDAGVAEADIQEYWQAAISGAENFSLKLEDIANRADALSESLKGIDELGKRMEEGSLTGEDIQKLQEAGVDLSTLQRTADGWKLVGDEAKRALQIMKGELIEGEQLTTKALEDLYKEGPEEMAKYFGTGQEIFDPITGQMTYSYNGKETEKRFAEAYQMAQKNQAYAEASRYTAQENEVRGGSEESIIYSAQNQAQQAGYDTEELDAYALSLQGINENLQNNKATAYEVALGNMNLNAGLGEIINSYDDWSGLIDKDSGLIKATTSEDAKAYNDLRKSVNKMLNTSEDLSDEFWNNAENIENVKKAAEGDTEALGELQKAAAKDYLVNLDLDPEGEKIVTDFANKLGDWELPTLEAGVELTGQDEFIAACQEMINASGMTADQVSEYFKRLGYDVEFDGDPQPVTQTRSYPQTTYTIEYDDQGNMSQMTPHTEMVPVTWTEDIMAPTIKTLTSTGSGGGGVSTKNLSGGKGNASKGKKGGGGGKGSSKKQNNWKNPYDKYYNLTEKINEALRTREKIERDYDRILNRRERTVAELLANSQAEVGNLQKEIQYQKQLQAGRREQIQNVAGERYDNGDQITTFEKMGVTKYANYNFDTQTIEIDWAAIEAVRDEELGKAIEAYVSRLEELQGQFEETQDTIEEMEDQIWEINQRGKSDYLELEAKTIQALINVQQKIIDDLSDKFESINNANDNILNNMQEQIDLERQIRDNTKTEDDIAKKEARLAYLRRDTSGANATEIMKLEQELADARQNYTDTLIDQGMQKLSDENQKAAEQRQQQIDIMQAQLDWTAESGGFNQKAQELIDAAAKTGLTGSELEDLLQEDEGWAAMTTFAQTNWTEELTKSFKAAIEGMGNFKVEDLKTTATSSKNAEKMKDASGKNEASIWWDSSKGQWIDKDGNEYDVAYDAEKGYYYSNKRTPKKAEEPKTETPKTDSTPKPDTSKKESDKTPSTPSSSKKYYKAQIKDGTTVLWTGKTRHTKTEDAELEGRQYIAKMRKDKYEAWKQSSPAEESIFREILAQWNRARAFSIRYKTGGLADFTGPAWLDGTKAHPELVLNARDAENFIQLKDILSDMGSLDKLQNGGDNYYNFDIKVDQLASDYDVDKLIGKIKNEITKDAVYRNTNAIHLIR